MARMIPVKIIYEQLYLKFGYDENRYYEFKEFLDNLPKADAVPANYIFDFIEHRDPVYQSNLVTMIRTYNQGVEENEKIPITFELPKF